MNINIWGCLIILIAGGAIYLVARRWYQKNKAAVTAQIASVTGYGPSANFDPAKVDVRDRIDQSMEQRIQGARAGDAVILEEPDPTAKATEKTVTAAGRLHQMWQVVEGEGEFVPKPGADRRPIITAFVILGNDTIIMKVPSQESGAPIWLKSTATPMQKKMQVFFVGTKDNKGPARIFANNGQETPVPYESPMHTYTDATRLAVVDIGRFKLEMTGKSQYFTNGDSLPFVTSRNVLPDGTLGDIWLIYLDSRPNLASSASVWIKMEKFDPDLQIQQLL